MKSKPSLCAAVATDNRLFLLQPWLQAIRDQTASPNCIPVINNGGTDGTKSWMEGQTGLPLIHQENSGASGGFYRGIKEAIALGYDWVWCMEADVIPDATEKKQLFRYAITVLHGSKWFQNRDFYKDP